MGKVTKYRVIDTRKEKVGIHDAARPFAVLAEEHGSSYKSINATYVADRYPTRAQAQRRARTLETRA